jgi:hypothetical protein
MQDFEKLGVFYLGKEYDLGSKKLLDNLLLYDSRDLVTHAVVVGMTGSGKTGLCIDLIEEAAIDGVPSILIDPKGDLTNLLLNFPGLKQNDFLPWVNPDDASRKGLSNEDYASQQAAAWQKGLSDWGQDGQRIARLRNSAEFVIYSPGSNAGIPVSILKSFAVPPIEIMEDGELLQDRINTTVSSLLGLLNIDADPLQSREHILLSTIIGKLWSQGQDIDLAALIAQIQKPPMAKIGILDLESFYPTKDRFKLVMALNNLLASPGFNAWLEGIPLDIAQILHTPQGKPKVSIFSIAHLGDAERMFFVSLLLNQILGWMRTQPGTTSLRALLYMDEIFGYFPPISNPPSKKPLLTLLKQARAFGIGVVLATQNPVDLDYKGLSNTGTWFIGRLQTERDKERVMDGLEGASTSAGGSFDRQKISQILAGLGSRVFLMNNTHDDEPVIFQTRWSLSYLRGPLTRNQIKVLMDPYKSSSKPVEDATQKTPQPSTAAAISSTARSASSNAQPALLPDINQLFIPVRGGSTNLSYRPTLVGSAKVRFNNVKTKLDAIQSVAYLTAITDDVVPVDWSNAEEINFDINDLEKSPVEGARFEELPDLATKSKNYQNWNRDFVTWLYGTQKLELFFSPSTGQYSSQGETERNFRVRLSQASRERRDRVTDELRKKYAPKINTLQERIRKGQQAVDRESAQAKQAGLSTVLSFGATILGAFMGRKVISSSNVSHAASALQHAGKAAEQSGDIGRAKETVAALQKQLDNLNEQFKEETDSLINKTDPTTEQLETISIVPKKTDITVQLVSLVWAPYRNGNPSW